jgi:hypothetical protein
MRFHKSVFPLITLLLVWAMFFWRFAAPIPVDRLTYRDSDFTQQFGAFRMVVYEAVLHGRLPIWEECLNSGYPFYADPQAQLWYPPVWVTMGVLRLMGWRHFPIEALVFETTAHYLALSYGLYFFLRSRQLRPWAAVLGAVVFTYGGYLTGSPPVQTATLNTNFWLPLALLWSGQWADTRQVRWLGALTLTLALAFFAGHPQTFLYVTGLTLAYFVYRTGQAAWPGRAILGALLTIIAITTLLAAIQLLPSVQFIAHSTRARLTYDQAGHGFPLADVVQFFLTGFVSYRHPLYIGILPLALVAFALLRPQSEIRFWVIIAVSGLVLSFGAAAALYDVAYWLIPGYGLFRGQEHLALLVSFALAVLAAYGADLWLGPLKRQTRWHLAQGGRALRAGVGWALLALFVLSYLARIGFDPSDWKQLPERAGVLVLAVGLAAVMFGLRQGGPTLRRSWPYGLVLVVAIDLFAANRSVNVGAPVAIYPPSPLIEPLTASQNGFFRVQDELQLPGHAGCGYGFRAIDSITPYQIATYARFIEAAPASVRWAVLAVRYLVTWREQVYDAPTALVVSALSAPGVPNKAGVTQVYRLAGNPTDRAWIAQSVRVAASPAALAAALQDPFFDPRRTVILPEAAPARVGIGQVWMETDTSGALRLRASTTGPAVLVVSVVNFPGWQAEVNGAPARVVLANGAVVGVPLATAGEHYVTLTFRPTVLWIGAVITGLSWVLCVGLLFHRRRLWPG